MPLPSAHDLAIDPETGPHSPSSGGQLVQQQKHLPALDGLRAVAVIAVFLFHYFGGNRSHSAAVRLVAHIVKAGWSGVTLFFVLSGFLITGILWDSFSKPHWIRNFYARRALRILPLYYLSLLLVLLGAAVAKTLHAALGRIWIPTLFLQNMPHLSGLSSSIASPMMIFHFWSLAVEEQFYLLWPFLLVLLRRSRRNALYLCLTVFILSALFRVLTWTTFAHPDDYWQFLPTRAGELALGSALALLYRSTHWHTVQRCAPMVALASLAGFIASSTAAGTADLVNRTQLLFGLPLITLFCAALLVLALRPGPLQRALSVSFLRWIGSLSYGIYVFHILLSTPFHALAVLLCGKRSETVILAAQLFIVMFGSVAVAWLSYTFFETPFLKLKRKYPSVRAV